MQVAFGKAITAALGATLTFSSVPSLAATQFVTSPSTGWQTFTINLPTDKTFDALVTIGLSNQGDTLADPEMLIDNLGGTVGFGAAAGNRGFETGTTVGYSTLGWTSVLNAPIFGAAPTEGSHMLRMIGTGTSTSDYTNANGAAGTDGSLLRFVITAASGGLLSFNWNFFNNEVGPYVYRDFAFVNIASVAGDAFHHYEVLAQIASPPTPVPVPTALWLFSSGLLGMLGAARLNGSARRQEASPQR